MTEHLTGNRPYLRKLMPLDRAGLVAHLQRLTPEDRLLRFGSALSDEAIARHVEKIRWGRDLLVAAFEAGEIRAVGELYPHLCDGRLLAEAAFSVEAPWRRRALASALAERLLRTASLLGIEEITLEIRPENLAMRALARASGYRVKLVDGEVTAGRKTPRPLLGDLFLEGLDDFQGAFLEGLNSAFLPYPR